MGAFNALGVADGEQLEHKMLSNAIETAQKNWRQTTSVSVKICLSMIRL